VVAAETAALAQQQYRQALRISPPPETLELRLDYLREKAQRTAFLRWLSRQRRGPAMIATCRRRAGGGRFTGSAEAEIAVLAEAAGAGCRWCDVEIETAAQFAPAALRQRLAPARLFVSAHDFRRVPRDLAALIRKLDACEADAVKIAAACASFSDVLRLLRVARHRTDVVAVPMGEEALAARVLALREGSALTYAAIDEATAPGQISLEAARQVYRLHRRFGRAAAGPTRRTRVYGVIGDPIAHSLSPLMHNAAFAARGMDAIFLPFHVRDLADFAAFARGAGLAGFAVTIPHKERILRYLDRCDALAAEIGAVNTVAIRAGRLCGYNTDYAGVLRALEKRIRLRGARVLLLGAGGAARAAAFALARSGAAVAICARRPERARELAHAVGGESVERGALRRDSFDAIVNGTPVGMHPHGGSPLGARELRTRVVMDLIYRPLRTDLLRLAERTGIETISGLEMFVAQGAAQQELWTGARAPEAVMRRAVLGALQQEEKRFVHRRGARRDRS
jgi:3-dehydroquinate dehydratase/shikimate dehydrogenase